MTNPFISVLELLYSDTIWKFKTFNVKISTYLNISNFYLNSKIPCQGKYKCISVCLFWIIRAVVDRWGNVGKHSHEEEEVDEADAVAEQDYLWHATCVFSFKIIKPLLHWSAWRHHVTSELLALYCLIVFSCTLPMTASATRAKEIITTPVMSKLGDSWNKISSRDKLQGRCT